jgi:NAD-dependent dihydropyrimidine dehydrogenase PreA subunit
MTSYRQILVDGSPVGMQGLDAIFATLEKEAVTPQDERLAQALIERVGKDNYIPHSARDIYIAALGREYEAFLAREGDAGAGRNKRYRRWRGIPREQIPWYPTVDEDLCNGCNICLRMCTTGALVATENGKVYVVEPFACVVGCNSCAKRCKPGAILFPPRSILEAYQPTSKHARPNLFGRR